MLITTRSVMGPLTGPHAQTGNDASSDLLCRIWTLRTTSRGGWPANLTDAEDVVQHAYLRAYRYFDAFHGGNFRLRLLTIVRNCFMTWARKNRSSRLVFNPDTGEMDAGFHQKAAQGLQLLTWRKDGIQYCAVSDLEPDRLATFARLIAGA
jgi:DNA-directed RNA polymerase specialized sigma24 family protein